MQFDIGRNIRAKCETYETRYSWGHKAWLYVDNREIAYKKITYYNRTWESYQFQTILSGLCDMAEHEGLLSEYYIKRFRKLISNKWVKEEEKKVSKQFGLIGAIAPMGEVFGTTQQEKNDWKTRIIKAGFEGQGLIMPDDWDTLSEDEKETRLNAVIQSTK